MNCDVCHGLLPAQKKSGRPRKTCSQRCHNWKTYHPGIDPKWLSPRNCEQCGKVIDSTDIRLRFCNRKCRSAKAKGSEAQTERACRFCEKPFLVNHSRRVYCNNGCRAKYHYRFGDASKLRKHAHRRGSIANERFTMLDIANRDGWVCGLCLGPIDPQIRGDYRLQATVDHILPVSKGGDHTLKNSQLTHWTCNAAKRDSTDVITMSVPTDEARVIMRWLDKDQSGSPTAGVREVTSKRRRR